MSTRHDSGASFITNAKGIGDEIPSRILSSPFIHYLCEPDAFPITHAKMSTQVTQVNVFNEWVRQGQKGKKWWSVVRQKT